VQEPFQVNPVKELAKFLTKTAERNRKLKKRTYQGWSGVVNLRTQD